MGNQLEFWDEETNRITIFSLLYDKYEDIHGVIKFDYSTCITGWYKSKAYLTFNFPILRPKHSFITESSTNDTWQTTVGNTHYEMNQVEDRREKIHPYFWLKGKHFNDKEDNRYRTDELNINVGVRL